MGILIKSGEKMKPGIDYVGVGVAAMIVKDKQVLLHLRKGSHGEGTWSLPGGHLELNETFEQGAIRETKEEFGVDIKPIKVISVSNNLSYGKHYVTIGLLAEIISGEPRVMEPDRCTEIKWFPLNKLPKNLFQPSERTIAHYRGEPLG
jgi:8-oxo-dGTP diphosphatase